MKTEGRGSNLSAFSVKITISFRRAFQPFCTTPIATRHPSTFNYGLPNRVVKPQHLSHLPQLGEYLAFFIPVKGDGDKAVPFRSRAPQKRSGREDRNHQRSGR